MSTLIVALSLLAGEPAIADIPGALAELPAEGHSLTFARGSAELPRGGHLQGIQMRYDAASRRHIAFLSHDSLSVAYLVVVEFTDLSQPGRVIHVHTFPSDGRTPPLRHAGGIQLAGDILAVGLEDNQLKTRSEVQFWNVAAADKPVQLAYLTVRRSGPPKDQTAGAVGIIDHEGRHLAAVANWDSRDVDLYRTNGHPLTDTLCRFEPRARWRDVSGDKSGWHPNQHFAPYQAINFVTDSRGKLYLLGFAADTAGRNVVDLFTIDLAQLPEGMIRKVASRPLTLPAGNQFRYSGGAWFDRGRLAILASPQDVTATTVLSITEIDRAGK